MNNFIYLIQTGLSQYIILYIFEQTFEKIYLQQVTLIFHHKIYLLFRLIIQSFRFSHLYKQYQISLLSKSFVQQLYVNIKQTSFIILKDLFQEKVTFNLQSNSAINTTFLNDQQDIILKLSFNNRILQIITLDRPLREQKDDDQNMNTYLQQTYPYQQQYKLKIDFKLEDTDEIDVNGNDNVVTILTKAQIKQQKNDQNKKQIQFVHQDIANKSETQIVQIQFKFLREWHLKLGNNLYAAKKLLQDYFKSLQITKIKFTAFDNQAPGPEQPIIQSQPDLNKKQSIKTEVKQEPEKEQEEVEQPAQISEKDLQNLFPLVSEEYVQRQRETLDKKNCTSEEKIKRLFEEVRIKQFKQQPYNADKNFFKCPYHRCQKGYKRPNQLKNHLKQNHQKLSEIGFTIDDNGEYKYNERILDYCLLLWKVYPNFVKSVINEMRQRKEQPSA